MSRTSGGLLVRADVPEGGEVAWRLVWAAWRRKGKEDESSSVNTLLMGQKYHGYIL